jgi:hypothetical protein
MPYSTIQPPFTLKFPEMSKRELKDYYRWFFEVLPERISHLACAVRETPGFETWQPDESTHSLIALDAWFGSEVATRERTPQEKQRILGESSYEIEISDRELTNRTFSLAMDIGMYLGLVFLRNHPSLKWEQPLGSRRFVDYGQPVLVGFGKTVLNPVHILVIHAYRVVSKEEENKTLFDLFNIWSGDIK